MFSSGTVIMRMMVSVPAERPPRVVRADPPRGRTRVPLNSIIVITPTEPLWPDSVTPHTVRLLQNGMSVAATVSLSSDGLRVELIPEHQLNSGTTYVIWMSAAVRDLAGDPFGLEYTSPFTTVNVPSPPGTIVFWAGATISKMNVDGTGITNLAYQAPGRFSWPVISPDGRLVAFYNDVNLSVDLVALRGFIYIADTSFMAVPRRLVHAPMALFPSVGWSWNSRPAWSPDGSKIIFASTRDDSLNQDIYVVNIDGTGVSRLTMDPAVDREPWWSPDGSRVVFVSDRGGNVDLYVMNADGSNVTQLTTHPAHDESPSWSPDGNRIVFQSQRDGNHEIYVMDADGTNVVRLTDHPDDDLSPTWSPDGTSILFSERGVVRGLVKGDLWTMNPDGTGLVNLTTRTNALAYSASWGP